MVSDDRVQLKSIKYGSMTSIYFTFYYTRIRTKIAYFQILFDKCVNIFCKILKRICLRFGRNRSIALLPRSDNILKNKKIMMKNMFRYKKIYKIYFCLTCTRSMVAKMRKIALGCIFIDRQTNGAMCKTVQIRMKPIECRIRQYCGF